ncbi:MAG TPA: RNB domain-containing ribonuclease, partial [bacterium]|nr:RNB domain-containing ribonuclease [bacterium]
EPRARTDLTGTLLVTIDPVDARDFDDAVGWEPLPNGHEKLWVAIADVAAYVRPGSALDAEAYQKGTSVYFPSRVLPMLPEELSNHLCSLKPREPRPALVVELELDRAARPVQTRFHQALIRSSARLNYAQVQAFLESGHPSGIADAAVRIMLVEMQRVARALRARRARRGAVEFEFAEVRFTLDSQGLPVGLAKAYPTEATRLVEQFMLEANEAVARQGAALGWPMLYRVHDPPLPDALRALALHLWNAGLRPRADQLAEPAGVQAVLRELKHHPQREQLELQILRAMSQARYRESNDGHFALAAPDYTHFTSPIRRYPDVLVHRALKAWLAAERGEPVPLPPLPDQAGAHCSAAERAAADLEQQVNRLYRVLYMEPRLGEAFAATLS